MGRWLIEGLECDPLQWWVELMKSWTSSDFKNCLRWEMSGRESKTNLEGNEEYILVSELGVGPSRWIDSGY